MKKKKWGGKHYVGLVNGYIMPIFTQNCRVWGVNSRVGVIIRDSMLLLASFLVL